MKLEKKLALMDSISREGLRLLASQAGEPEDWPDAAKLRLHALWLDKYDLDREVFDRNGVQRDLRRIADRIEELEEAGIWRGP